MPLSNRDLRAVANLTTQVRRIADAMTTPVAEAVDDVTATPDDAPTTVKLGSWVYGCPTGRHVAHSEMDCAEADEWKATFDEWMSSAVARFVSVVVTPVVEQDDDEDALRTARRRSLRVLLNQLNTGAPLTPEEAQFLARHVAEEIVEGNTERRKAGRLNEELARVRRALDPDDETYIRETVDEQARLNAKVAEQQAAIQRVRALLDTHLGPLATAAVQRALDGTK